MTRLVSSLTAIVLLGACTAGESLSEQVAAAQRRGDTVSAMNYLLEPVDPICAKRAVLDTDGFALRGDLSRVGGRREGDVRRFEAMFNDDLPLSVIVRTRRDRTAEVSVFSKLRRGASPLDRREAEFAVGAADEAIYRACTEDGRAYPEGDGDVVIEAE